jgi:circadian clock protein KaiB
MWSSGWSRGKGSGSMRDDRGTVMAKGVLKLYVAGRTPTSESAVRVIRRLCAEELRGEFELVIIDVLENPQAAEDERILATPTLIKESPPPARRIIGDLSDCTKVLESLGVDVVEPPTLEGGTL